MISLRYFVLILLTLCCRESAVETSLPINGPMAGLIVFMLVFGFTLLAKAAAIRAIRTSTINGARFAWLTREYFQISRQKIERMWCWLAPLTMLLTGWFRWTVDLQNEGWSQSLMLASCFLPTMIFLAAVEAIGAQLDQSHKTKSNRRIGQSWATRMRLGEVAGLATCLLPVLLIASVSDVSIWAGRVWGLDQTVVSTVASIGLGILFVMIFPSLLTKLSGGRPLEKALADRVQGLMQRSKVRGIASAWIASNGRWAGAAVIGWVPGFRKLWLGDALVGHLSQQEVDMVVLHEIAHVKRHHFLWRLFPVVWSMGAGLALWLVADQFGFADLLATKLVAAVVTSWLLLFGLGNLARRCEIDADWTACNLAVEAMQWQDELSPAEALCSALSKLLEGSAAQQRTWLHPSLETRLESLRRWQLNYEATVLHRRSDSQAKREASRESSVEPSPVISVLDNRQPVMAIDGN